MSVSDTASGGHCAWYDDCLVLVLTPLSEEITVKPHKCPLFSSQSVQSNMATCTIVSRTRRSTIISSRIIGACMRE